jgi:hypothetical protein
MIFTRVLPEHGTGPIYINPEQVCWVQPLERGGTTVFMAAGPDIELVESFEVVVQGLFGSQVPSAVKISQGGFDMSITGTPVGGQSTFEADAILNGVADPAGFPAGSVDTWTVDDPAISVAPDSGPNNSQVVVSVPATDTQGSAPAGSPPSYNLTVSVQMPGTPAPAPLTMTVNVPITPAPVPLPTAVAINQVS